MPARRLLDAADDPLLTAVVPWWRVLVAWSTVLMRIRHAVALVVVLSIAMLAIPRAGAQTLTVRGVLFFSPACGHCEYVIQEVLPPLFDQHGGPWEIVFDEAEPAVAFYLLTNGTIEMLLADVTVAAGAELFQATTDALAIGSNGVPRLIVGNQVMIGSTDIPGRLPALVDSGLAADGIGWPDLPGLEEIVASLPTGAAPTTTTSPTTTVDSSTTTTVATAGPTLPVGGDADGSFGDDAVANSMAVVVLLGLLVAVGGALATARRDPVPRRTIRLVPILAILGIVIAGYLTYVEIGGVEAVCGPVGDCNTVQQSEYARVAGIPIGLIGLAGYVAILGAWILQRRPPTRRADLARVFMAIVTVVGVVFSAWLTFLEPFVIHATCAWCLGSAVVTGLLMWLAVPTGVASWRRLAPVSGSEKFPA